MAEVFFDNPPILQGEERDQLMQLQRYLNAMSEKLNTALMSISIEQLAPETQQTIRTAEDGAGKAETNYTALKSLIIKTAEIVRTEMDEIRTTLERDYVAHSELYGTYEQHIQQDITATANGVLHSFTTSERFTGIEDNANDAKTYINKADSFIFMGIIGTDANNDPVTGIAIGDGVTGYDQQGNPQINDSRKMATFTANRLSFYMNNTEVAYFANNTFHIASGEVTRTMKMGNHIWQVLTGGALALIAGSAS